MALRDREGYADLVYGRARHDRDGPLWLQYWFFFYYDDRGLLGHRAARGRLADGAAAPRHRRRARRRRPWRGTAGAQRLRLGSAREGRLTEDGPVAVDLSGARARTRRWPRAGQPRGADRPRPQRRPRAAGAAAAGDDRRRRPGLGAAGPAAGDRPAGASTSRPTARAGRASIRSGGTRRRCTTKRGRRPGCRSSGRGGRRGRPAAARRAARANLAVVSYRFAERGAGRAASRRGSSPPPIGADGEPSRGHPHSRSRTARASSRCSCPAIASGAGSGPRRPPSAASAARRSRRLHLASGRRN